MKQLSIILCVFISLSTLIAQNKQHKIAEGIIEYHDLFNTTMNEKVSCYRIPAIVTAPNGDIVAVIDERVESCADLNPNNDINIVARRSSDNGKTWSEIETVVDFPFGQSASDPSMIVDRETNEIFMFYNYMDLVKEKGIYYLHVMKSADNGKTWSKPVDITAQITKPEWHNDFKFITSGRGEQTRSGKLLHTMVNLKNGLHLFGSDDHGKTWFFIDTPINPADESKVMELADGTWMINSRVYHKGLRIVHTSKDEGKTWETNEEPQLTDPGNNASFIRYTAIADGYDKNRILFSNSNDKKDRKNLTVKISYDEGATWSGAKTIYAGSAAYSSMTILENGDIGLFFEKNDYTENVFVSFSLEWLTDGKDVYKAPTK